MNPTSKRWSRYLLVFAVLVAPIVVSGEEYKLPLGDEKLMAAIEKALGKKMTKEEARAAYANEIFNTGLGYWGGTVTSTGGCKNSVGDPCGSTYSRGAGGGLFGD